MQTVGGAGILARITASSRNLLSILLQCRGQECPQLLQFALSIMHISHFLSFDTAYNRSVYFIIFTVLPSAVRTMLSPRCIFWSFIPEAL